MSDQLNSNKAVVRRFLEEFLSCGDSSVADEVLAAEFVDHHPSNPALSGIENIKATTRAWCGAFPDTRTVVDDVIAEGDRVAARWTSTATHRGEFMGIAATGTSVSVSAAGLFRLAGGRIVESWDHFDAIGLLRQLGH